MNEMDRSIFLNPSMPLQIAIHGPDIPIIIIPDLMGTRLTDPRTGNLVWNPLGWPFGHSPGLFHVDFARLQQVDAELVPDELHLPPRKEEGKHAPPAIEDGNLDFEGSTIHHYHHLVPDLYGALAKALSKHDWLEKDIPNEEKLGAAPRVYCCGYDWRQDNARSALRLAQLVERALAGTSAPKVILVAHGMGGLVARYYCRVLGGEEKVAALLLLGSPSQGAPSAYTNLKHGIPAVYANELKNDIMTGDVSAAADEVSSIVGGLAGMVTSTAMGGGGAALGDFVGRLYLTCCIGAGHMLSRSQMVYFARQLPSLYQLLPTSTFCRDNAMWLFFDPLGTGVTPTGFLIRLPTTTGLNMMATEAVINAVDPSTASAFHGAVQSLMAAQSSADPNEVLLTANSVELVALGALGASAMSDPDAQTKMAGVGKALAARLQTTFIDGRDRRVLYEDVYTGFMDRVDMRAISAANLALSHRFDDALRMKPSPEAPITAKDLILPLIEWITPIVHWVTLAVSMGQSAVDGRARKQDLEKLKRKDNRIYMPLRTVCLYCDSLPTDGGSVIVAEDSFSSFDANQVKWRMFPKPAPAMGDGSVPVASAFPPEDVVKEGAINRALSRAFTDVVHADLPSDTNVLDAIKDVIKNAEIRLAWWS